jgi:6-methylsalicylate decarboxylase
MKALQEVVDPMHILFGSDFPHAPEPLVAKEISDLGRLEVFDEATRECVQRT